jgi:hypothetical protein
MWPSGDLVAVVHHRGQRGALAGAGGAHHQQQAALFHDQVGQDGRHVQAVQRRDFGRDEADHRGIGAALAEGADPEVAQAGDGQRHVELADFFQLLNALGRQHLGQQVARRVRRQDLRVDGNGLAVDLDQGGRMGRQVNVRRFFVRHQAKDSFHRAHSPPS